VSTRHLPRCDGRSANNEPAAVQMESSGHDSACLLRLQIVRHFAGQLRQLWKNSLQKHNTLHREETRERWDYKKRPNYRTTTTVVFLLFIKLIYIRSILCSVRKSSGSASAHPHASPCYRNRSPRGRVLRGGTNFFRCSADSLAEHSILYNISITDSRIVGSSFLTVGLILFLYALWYRLPLFVVPS